MENCYWFSNLRNGVSYRHHSTLSTCIQLQKGTSMNKLVFLFEIVHLLHTDSEYTQAFVVPLAPDMVSDVTFWISTGMESSPALFIHSHTDNHACRRTRSHTNTQCRDEHVNAHHNTYSNHLTQSGHLM